MKTELGDYVRRRRIELGKTIQEVADASGLPWRTVHSVENGDSGHPRRETLAALAAVLGEDVNILVLKAYAPPRAQSPADPVEVKA